MYGDSKVGGACFYVGGGDGRGRTDDGAIHSTGAKRHQARAGGRVEQVLSRCSRGSVWQEEAESRRES